MDSRQRSYNRRMVFAWCGIILKMLLTSVAGILAIFYGGVPVIIISVVLAFVVLPVGVLWRDRKRKDASMPKVHPTLRAMTAMQKKKQKRKETPPRSAA